MYIHSTYERTASQSQNLCDTGGYDLTFTYVCRYVCKYVLVWRQAATGKRERTCGWWTRSEYSFCSADR